MIVSSQWSTSYLSEGIMLDVGEDNRIIPIEVLDASRHLNLERLLPVKYKRSSA